MPADSPELIAEVAELAALGLKPNAICAAMKKRRFRDHLMSGDPLSEFHINISQVTRIARAAKIELKREYAAFQIPRAAYRQSDEQILGAIKRKGDTTLATLRRADLVTNAFDNCLRNAGLSDLREFQTRKIRDIAALPNLGENKLVELIKLLDFFHIRLTDGRLDQDSISNAQHAFNGGRPRIPIKYADLKPGDRIQVALRRFAFLPPVGTVVEVQQDQIGLFVRVEGAKHHLRGEAIDAKGCLVDFEPDNVERMLEEQARPARQGI